MSDHIPMSDEKRILEKAQPSQLPLQGTAPELAKSRSVVLAHLAAAKRAEGKLSGSSATVAGERDRARSGVDREHRDASPQVHIGRACAQARVHVSTNLGGM